MTTASPERPQTPTEPEEANERPQGQPIPAFKLRAIFDPRVGFLDVSGLQLDSGIGKLSSEQTAKPPYIPGQGSETLH